MAKENAVRANEPDYQLAAKILREAVGPLRDVGSKNNGDLSAAWKRVESEAGVNKAACKFMFGLLQKSDNHQDDVMRTIMGMAEQFNMYPNRKDLVDAAEADEEDGD